MEEKILIKSERQKMNKLSLIFAAIGVLFLVGYICFFKSNDIHYSVSSDGAFPFVVLGCMIFPLVGFIIYKCWSEVELVVTDKRVYGKAAFGKRVDLPLDSVSAVSTGIGSISVSTSSGTIKFNGIINYDEIHKVLSKLIIERQQNKNVVLASGPVAGSNADELKKYKNLLDGGIITQEEFDAKKKQLLGL